MRCLAWHWQTRVVVMTTAASPDDVASGVLVQSAPAASLAHRVLLSVSRVSDFRISASEGSSSCVSRGITASSQTFSY